MFGPPFNHLSLLHSVMWGFTPELVNHLAYPEEVVTKLVGNRSGGLWISLHVVTTIGNIIQSAYSNDRELVMSSLSTEVCIIGFQVHHETCQAYSYRKLNPMNET